jgi:acyl-CoA synthetase (AMP-forming)/AMP-acid ligase II
MPFPEYEPKIPSFLRLRARECGDHPAIVLGDRRLGYAALERQSAALARGLLARGLGKGSRVGLLMPNGPDWLSAFMAAARIGAVVVPLNTFHQTRELAWSLRHADVDTLLTVDRFLAHDYLERLEEAAPGLTHASTAPLRLPELPYLRRVIVWGQGSRAWTESGEALLESAGGDPSVNDVLLEAVEQEVTPADPLCVFYSSGSTADPKGAIHSHGAALRHSFNLSTGRDIDADDRVWSPMPFFWVGGFVFTALGNMQVGATTVCDEVFDPERTLRLLEREKVTVALGWPHFGKALAEHPTRPERDLSSLRKGNLPDILPDEISPADPELRATALGMTETCGPHTWNPTVGRLPEHERGSFGTAVEGVTHRVVDAETGLEVEPGRIGELWVRGYSLMQGLYKREREDVFEPDGFYRTGDAGFFDARGHLRFTGRLGDLIKTGGANVTPGEIEQLLLAYEEVKEAHVVGVAHPEKGQTVEAAVTLEAGFEIGGDALRARLKQEISAYKVPRHIFVYTTGSLPFTDTGKIDKRRLARELEDRIGSQA